MKLVPQTFKVLKFPNTMTRDMELSGRTCYKSNEKITETSAEGFVRTLIKSGHHAMLEFGDISCILTTNRGVTHELVRHRLFSFAQESTRYVKYNGHDMHFIRPIWLDEDEETKAMFILSCQQAESNYRMLMGKGWSAQKAREVLPNALKTEIVVKGNVREYRHMLKLRCSKQAHPQFRALALRLLKDFYKRCPVLFEDLYAEFFPEDVELGD